MVKLEYFRGCSVIVWLVVLEVVVRWGVFDFIVNLGVISVGCWV